MPDVSSAGGAAGGGSLDDAYNLGSIITVDAGAVELTDGGALPAISADTLLVVAQVSAAGDNAEISILAGTTGTAILNFGDSADEDVLDFRFDNNTSVATWNEAGTDIDFRWESSGSTNALFIDGGNDRVIIQADNGTLPSLSADTGLVIFKDAASFGNCEVSILSGFRGISTLNFGDALDEDTLTFDFNNLTNVFVTNEAGTDIDFRWETDTLSHMLFMEGNPASENIAFLTTATPNWQSMDRGYFLGDVTTAPTGNPTAGVFVWSAAGAAQVRGGGGTVTEWGPSGLHCGVCGSDFWTVASMNMNWKSWCFVCGVCDTAYKGGPQNVLSLLTPQQSTELIQQTSTWEDVKKLMKLVA